MSNQESAVGANEEKKPLFRDIGGDDDDVEHKEIESLCMNCEENGTTRFLFTRIPFFKDVIIASFSCPHCGFANNEIQPASKIQDKGIRYTVKISSSRDMNRKVVKQESGSFSIPELELEAPAFTQKGVMTTVEGLLLNTINGLEQNQIIRRHTHPETAAKIDTYIAKLNDHRKGDKQFTLIVEDISGNSYVENPLAPGEDPATKMQHFLRTKEQDNQLGLYDDENNADNVTSEIVKKEETELNKETMKQEVLCFPSNCMNCQSPVETHMKVIDVPHFKEVIIMAAACDTCGYRSNEVKPGAGIEPLGSLITFKITDAEDLNRDVLKSDTCEFKIPDLDLELGEGTLGGRFTTIEGLLTNVKDQLASINPFHSGDSSDIEDRAKMKDFLSKLNEVISGNRFVTIILDDPVGNSYIQNVYAPDSDPELTIVKYERTFEQNEYLGLNDMKTENYEEDKTPS